MPAIDQLSDLDHVIVANGKIYRVLGNIKEPGYFVGYNVYMPDPQGDRIYRGRRYRKQFIEDEQQPYDVLETYEVLPRSDVVEHLKPIESAQRNSASFHNTIWFALYEELITLFGADAVGIFGSSMLRFHLTPEGRVRKDVDFVIDGLKHIATLRHHLPNLRQRLGFQEVSEERQLQQYRRYQRVFQNNHNTIREIIRRRWTGLQLSEQVVSTLRFREKSVVLPLELVHGTTVIQRNAILSGRVTDADMSHLFPRMFHLKTEQRTYPVFIWWWKFSTPTREDDNLTICGDVVVYEGKEALRVTNFHDHWLALHS